MGLPADQAQKIKERLASKTEEEIREDLAMSRYGDGYKRTLAEEHLRSLDAGREDARHSAESDRSAKTVDLAEEANEIARGANKTARDANLFSMVAVGIALLALIVAALT